MLESHQLDLFVVDKKQRFVGELRALQFAKLLVPATVGPRYGMFSEISNSESTAENAEQVKSRIEPYLSRKVGEFVDHDVPVVTDDMPIAQVLMLLRGGQSRMPVVDAGGKLVGVVSMLTVLGRIRSA
jgi:CBS domain-containing protein